MYLLALTIIAICLSEAIHAYSSSPIVVNYNYFDVANSTLPKTTSHPPTSPPLGRYSFIQSEFQYEDEQAHDYGEYAEDQRLQWDYNHKRVAREQAAQPVQPQGRSLNDDPWGQGDDNYLHSEADNDGSEAYLSDQPVVLSTAWRERRANPNSINAIIVKERKYNSTYNKELKKKVQLHLKFMADEGSCKVPKPEVVHIPRKTDAYYSPRATILHRCNDRVGCCEPEFACRAKRNETVELVFSMIGYSYSEPIIILMENHTECGCVKEENRRKRSTFCQCPKHFNDFSQLRSLPDTQEVPHFSEERCRCDCHLSDTTCQRLKNGEEGFSVIERLRIQKGENSPPFCSYGPYDMKNGRCPRPEKAKKRNLQRSLQSRRQHVKS
ncbi:uncharacterized protein LOC108107146 [Drosophila eugracilis]|uniref:uncharacterized protein LOC108107146 n=1 Tax=Drosophila eugracilis TaxID=29029 RepID=UPI001BD9218C|nr:uncharacterized protein LOC108107146 [Drosophila eugracilis]XP_041675502.1 uncharacterized protein LOC108107146 [Drosophila eugracilis]